MMKPAITAIVLIAFLLSMAGCSHMKIYWGPRTAKPNFPLCPTGPLTLANPLVMTSIGVNQYRKDAGVQSTSAHLLSAAIFHEPFKVAAERTKQQRRNMLVFNSQSPVVLEGVSTAIEKLVFNADGSQIAATSKDGTVAVWRLGWMSASESSNPTAGSKAIFVAKSRLIHKSLKSRIRHVEFVNYHGVQALAFMDEEGHGELIRREGMATLAEFQHPGPARYMEVNVTGSRILTVGNDFTVRIWSVSKFLLDPTQLELPAFLEPCSAPEKVRAFFSNDGNNILVTRCDGVWVYSLHDLNRPPTRYRLPTDLYENTIEISRDGQLLAWVTRKSELCLRRIDSNEGKCLIDKNGVALSRPTISRDGRVVGHQFNSGWFAVWKEWDKREPLLLSVDRRVGQLSLSAGGEGGVAQSKHSVFAWDLRVWDDQKEALDFTDSERKVIPSLLLHSHILQQDRETPQPTTVEMDPLGEMAAIGFANGRIELYGARTSPEIELFSSVSLVADYWLPAESRDREFQSDPTLYGLQHLGGDERFPSLIEMSAWFEGKLKGSVGSPPEMTSQKIRETLKKSLDQAQRVYELNGAVVLVIYMSGHGRIGLDGEPYFLPGDAKKSDPASWISYSSVVREIDGFVGNNPKKRAVIIFDTCQTKPGEAGQSVCRIRSNSPYVTLVQSASPGQYAWRFDGATTISGATVTTEDRWGTIFPPKKERRKVEEKFETTMSALSLGSKCFLSTVAGEWCKTAKSFSKASDADPTEPPLNLINWLNGTKYFANQMIERIPYYTKHKKEFGGSQDIVMDIGEENASIIIFKIDSEGIHD